MTPDILYERPGVLVAQKSSKWTEHDFEYRPVRQALEVCGMTSHQVSELFLGFLPNLARFGSFRLSHAHAGKKIEEIVGYYDERGEVSPVRLVHYFPEFVKPGSSITTVFEDTAELILGLRRGGTLEIVPTLSYGDTIRLDTDHTTRVPFGEHTLAILGRKVQGNRWSHFPEMTHNRSSHIALFTTFPKPYEHAHSIPLTT